MAQATATPLGDVSIEDVDREAVLRNVDMLARRFLHMSGPEFLQCKERGALDELGDTPGVVRVLSAASLLD